MNNKIIATDGYINIINIIHGIDDLIQLDDGTQHAIQYDEAGMPYFMIADTRYNLDDFMRV